MLDLHNYFHPEGGKSQGRKSVSGRGLIDETGRFPDAPNDLGTVPAENEYCGEKQACRCEDDERNEAP